MSVGLLVVGAIACLLVMGLLGALAVLSKVEARHEARVGILTSERPRHAGTSGDVHLFLALPAAEADAFRGRLAPFGKTGAVPPERFAELADILGAAFARATHARADYGHFRKIRAQGVDATVLLYANVRTRRPITQMLEPAERAAWQRTLEALVALGPADVVEASVELAKPTTDPAAGKLAPLV